MLKNNKKLHKLLLAGVLLFCVYLAFTNGNKVVPINKLIMPDKAVEIITLDVGQADAIIVRNDKKAILIDSGKNFEDGKKIVEKLESYAIKEIKALVLTHPHKDHIGGAVYVIKKLNVEKIYMPNIVHTTESFEKLVEEIEKQEIKLIQAKAGDVLDAEGFNGEFLSPQNAKYDNLNDYSAVLKLNYQGSSALFMGDAGINIEKELMNNQSIDNIDFLKIGHHGSNTASSKEFLKKIAPKIAVISCGKDNDYGHPHKETLAKLDKLGLQVYRTDKLGDLHFLWTDSEIAYQQGE